MKKIILPTLIILLALGGIMYVLNKNKAKNEAQTAVVAQKNEAVTVRTGKAEYKELSSQYVANGTFSPKQEVKISAETAGRVMRVLVQEGSYVKAGQVLAVIESDKQNVNVSNAQAVFDNAQSEVERFNSAFASGGVTRQQLDQVKLQLENARNNLRSAQLAASDVNVKASFAGIVNSRSVEPGTYVSPGQQLFEIVDISSLKLKVQVDEKNVAGLQKGQSVSIIASVLPDDPVTGTITFIAPKGDAGLNFPVELEVKNPDGNRLKAGMYGTAYFGEKESVHALAVPREAFVGSISSNKIFVAENGKAILKDVVAGRSFGNEVEILSGLESGDTVIISGQINLLNETPIQIIQ